MKNETVWAMYYSAIASWQYHPGTKSRLTTVECAHIADTMLAEHMKRFSEQEYIHGLDGSSSNRREPTR